MTSIRKSVTRPLPHAVEQIAGALAEDPPGLTAFDEDVVKTARDGLHDYVHLLAAWPAILGGLDGDLREAVVAAASC